MIRRNTRLIQEYRYRKSLQGHLREEYDKKHKLREALKQGKQLPSELQMEAEKLYDKSQFDDKKSLERIDNIDDEYSTCGIKDPKIMITTSRDPSTKLVQFAKELRLILPNSQKINRGSYVISKIAEACNRNDFTDLILVHETKGVPDGMIVSHFPYGPTAYFGILNPVLRHDIKNVSSASESYPHLIFDNFNTKLGNRVQSILKYLFPVPKESSKRVITLSNTSDLISFRHHTFSKTDGKIELDEIGPRFELRLFQIKLGTIEIEDAEKEFIWRPYMNSKKLLL
ncbi:u3 small nucleolar ribonucleoprotein imp4 [Anaeramoeba flamelloides]|uniref:U3 small nucleolar ribonucleoprotein imp4 n=1 Tax=Anaeramoeba flamelloides TaxID=1746091 RepID=A0AAV8A6M4_9EUKA|nr:u3 small nucleolar ribonucleoprotein imp4 [Anaeramoeba flamelloides]KAJ6228873.1 u3 small nucleolar ribonucleoprotein imp4 [Anaeramoeba flamelloides]